MDALNLENSTIKNEIDKIVAEETIRLLRENENVMAEIRNGVIEAITEFDFFGTAKEGSRFALINLLSNPSTYNKIPEILQNSSMPLG